MVSVDSVDNLFVFLVLTCVFNAELDVRAVKLVVESLTYIVEKACTLCKLDVCADFGSHKTCKVGNLKRVVKNVLTVAGAVSQAAENFDKLGMNTVDTCVENGSFTCLFDCVLNLFACLFVHFLNAGRVNSAVGNELFESESCDLSANGVKA